MITLFKKLEFKRSHDYFQGKYIILVFQANIQLISGKKWKNIVHTQTLMVVFKEIHGPFHKKYTSHKIYKITFEEIYKPSYKNRDKYCSHLWFICLFNVILE